MNSFIGWIGGKKLLREEIVKRFPPQFGRYIEVFGGAAWVLFHRDRHAELEVYNDYNSELVNLFRCVKFHCAEVQKELSYLLNSREVFEDFKAQYIIRGLTDIQRAARFFILIKTSYGSQYKTYGCNTRDTSNMVDYLAMIQKRLSKVVIENKSYGSVIQFYNKPDALFYLDPPYYGTEKYYSVDFGTEDHLNLKELLTGIKGRLVLSYNDCQYIRDLYQGFNIEAVNRNNNLVGRYNHIDNRYSELVIRNY